MILGFPGILYITKTHAIFRVTNKQRIEPKKRKEKHNVQFCIKNKQSEY